MPTPDDFQLGILPERKLDRRALAAAYGLLILLIIVMINIGWIWPDSLNVARQYHVTELVPMPSLRPEPLKVKPPAHPLRAKLLPAAPVFEAPKLTVPREIRAPKPHVEEEVAPKIAVNTFTPTVLRQVTGGARPSLIIHTGEFGSSATPTVNAPIEKVQTGGFGDPNGIPGQGKPNAHLVAANSGASICRKVPAPAMVQAETKGSKARLPAPASATASRRVARVTAAAMDAELRYRPPDSPSNR